jgi:hypothetical protein
MGVGPRFFLGRLKPEVARERSGCTIVFTTGETADEMLAVNWPLSIGVTRQCTSSSGSHHLSSAAVFTSVSRSLVWSAFRRVLFLVTEGQI